MNIIVEDVNCLEYIVKIINTLPNLKILEFDLNFRYMEEEDSKLETETNTI